MKIEFKIFEPSESDELIKMVRALYSEDSYGEKMTVRKIKKTLHELTNHPERGKILLFLCENMTVGYAIVINHWSNELGNYIIFIDELYVKPAWRRRGIATHFLKYLYKSDKTSIKAIQLEVTPTNQAALEFYLRQGFRIISNKSLIKKK